MSPTAPALTIVLVVVALTAAAGGQDFPTPLPFGTAGACTACGDPIACGDDTVACGDSSCTVDCGCQNSACGDPVCGTTIGGNAACGRALPCPVNRCCALWGTPADFCDAFTNQGPCDPSGCRSYCQSSCDMPQHMAYFPDSHGYYYFKPYNFQHLPQHQQFVASFGGDTRNPYDISILDNLTQTGTSGSRTSLDDWQAPNDPSVDGTEDKAELVPQGRTADQSPFGTP